jgi:hypothetical protein
MSKIVELKGEEAKQVSGGGAAIVRGVIGLSLGTPTLPSTPVKPGAVGPAGSTLQNR